jgi:3-deoxy-D-manno-octulosonic-acid transferase
VTHKLSQILYNGLILPVIWGGSYVLWPVSPKIRKGLRERRNLVSRVREFRGRPELRPLIHFHCASAGEFESLVPLARGFDRQRFALSVSYFSPSARPVAGPSHDFDFADYSPIDCRRHTAEFLDALRPALVAITKHDVWPNFVWAARERGIPLFLVNGNFHAGSLRLKPVMRSLHREVYRSFSGILAVSEEDARRARLLTGEGTSVEVMGDSRFDQVLARVDQRRPLPADLEQAAQGRPVLVAGSTHMDDEQLLLPVIPRLRERIPNLLTVVVPHDPSARARGRILDLCSQHRLTAHDLDGAFHDEVAAVWLVNCTGMLADLYRVGQVAYVGGGFGKGVHSVLEPLAAGLPVVCGPHIGVSNEARVAESEGVLHVVRQRRPAEEKLGSWLSNPEGLDDMKRRAIAFVRERSGAAPRIRARLIEAVDARAGL